MPWIGVREIPTDGERGSNSESGVLSTWMGVRVISLVGERGSNFVTPVSVVRTKKVNYAVENYTVEPKLNGLTFINPNFMGA